MGDGDNWTAAKILGISDAYWQSCTLHCAVSLDIFSRLAHECRTVDELAELLDADRRGLATLLDALAAMGLLAKDGDCFTNTASARRFLVNGGPEYIGNIIMHHHHLLDGWAQLERAVRRGQPVEKRSYGEERERESFQLGMLNLAMGIAPHLAEQVDLQGCRHLLDLGGGPGTYAIHFCRANPKLRATIVDRPTTREFAIKAVRFFGLGDRIDFMSADFTVDPLPGRYDVAWVSQVLHSYAPEECRTILAKVVAGLEPGGLIMVHEFFLNNAKDGPLFPALFSLNMLINNPSGRSYAEREMGTILASLGVGGLRRLPFVGPNESYVLCGRLPAGRQ